MTSQLRFLYCVRVRNFRHPEAEMLRITSSNPESELGIWLFADDEVLPHDWIERRFLTSKDIVSALIAERHDARQFSNKPVFKAINHFLVVRHSDLLSVDAPSIIASQVC